MVKSQDQLRIVLVPISNQDVCQCIAFDSLLTPRPRFVASALVALLHIFRVCDTHLLPAFSADSEDGPSPAGGGPLSLERRILRFYGGVGGASLLECGSSVVDSLLFGCDVPPTLPIPDLGAAYGTAKAGVGIASMGIMHPTEVMKNIVPVIMAGTSCGSSCSCYTCLVVYLMPTRRDTLRYFGHLRPDRRCHSRRKDCSPGRCGPKRVLRLRRLRAPGCRPGLRPFVALCRYGPGRLIWLFVWLRWRHNSPWEVCRPLLLLWTRP